MIKIQLSEDEEVLLCIIGDNELFERNIDWIKVVKNGTFSSETIERLLDMNLIELKDNDLKITSIGSLYAFGSM